MKAKKTLTKNPIFAIVNGANWHLRPEDSLSNESSDHIFGILIINGAKVLYLNTTAYDYVAAYLSFGQNHFLTILRAVFRHMISPWRACRDWGNLYRNLQETASGCCEGTDIEILSTERHFSAPIRVDLALTYRCNNDCTHCYAGGHHETLELSTEEWCEIIDKLHTAGIPQVIFTGGESLIREDLAILVHHAKSRHMITGLITNGRLLTKERVLNLAEAGLDFVQITIESIDPVIHNEMVGFSPNSQINALEETLAGIENAITSSLQVTTNTTVTDKNAATILPTISYLISMGVQRIGINGLIRAMRGIETAGISTTEMQAILKKVLNLCETSGVQMIWFTPTCYQKLNPLFLGLGVKCCSAASIVLAIEPTGRVLPCQSYFAGLGDARYDSFHDIWNHPLAVSIREKSWVKDVCRKCSDFRTCGGGCPLEADNIFPRKE